MCESTTDVSADGSPNLAQAMARHEGLVRWVVSRQWLGALPFDDALQEGRLALWSALCHYDPQRGVAFSTYAVPAIAHAVWRAVALDQRQAAALPREPVLDGGLGPDAFEQAEVNRALRQLLDALPERLRLIVVAHHGLDGTAPRTFAALGSAMGVSRQRVHQLYTRALLRLAHPELSLFLRRLLGCNTRRDYQRALTRQRQARRRQRRRWEARR